VYANSGKAWSSFSFSNHVLLTATFALSFVSRGRLPVKNDLTASTFAAIESSVAVAFREGPFLLKPAAMVSCNFLNAQVSPLMI
jgi:hypothetical protein